ncbi:hypothetical protein UFOVP760_126 [uncultured Caudovirales phage]|uniref:Uncharacterized protein n=1 Tax=uncultured Caudovirales phage TaxID=2100421 RepID=A0A6J7X8X8_9CAUD|nr:hypothetical protein UFOVP760_126 [uncultured Caudovirales phage]
MGNTSSENELIEVETELTISDIKTLDGIIDACLDVRLFKDESIQIVKDLSSKIKSLIVSLE